jgi:serine/threonine-protein kinase
MNPARWKQIKHIFEEATAKPESERSEFLDRACEHNTDLRGEVESLLASLTSSGQFLEPPSALREPHTAADLNIGKHFGPYRIEHLIGHGGMGAVYKAVRDDGQFHKLVAIKLVRPGAWWQELSRRFHQERQTLARLEHPNIAALLDGGTTADGTSYLIMEFIDGRPIDTYCDEEHLSISERLALFRVVCAAVQHAHRNLIVHRDLKPGNILVTANGIPKLLDFGIAKLLDESHHAEPHDVTRVGLRFVTLEYASPEQIKGEVVTTASDVYSLGVLLYKLLTGRSPYQFKSRLPHDMTRTICEQQPLKPSTGPQKPEHPSPDSLLRVSSARGVSPERLRRQLSGDLDTILLKALHKDPQRRYLSVEQFSEDLRRHLEGLPVFARPDTLDYRVTKFVRRHAIGVTAIAVILLAVVGGLIGILWQANKATKEAAKAEQINSFLREMLSSADPAKIGKDVTVAQTLDLAVQRVDKELGSQPEIAASVCRTIGETYIALGLYDKARVQLERSLRLWEDVLGPEHEEIATTIHSLAYLTQLSGAYAIADSLYQIAIAMHRKTHPSADQHLVSMMSDYGTLLRDRRQSERAVQVLRESVELGRAVSGTDSKDYAYALSNLGPALLDLHELAATESVYMIAIPLMKKFLGEGHIDLANAENNLAFVLLEKNDSTGAEKLFRHSLQIRRTVLGNDHPEVTIGLVNLSGLLLRQGNVEDAEKLASEAVAILRKSVQPDNVKLSSALLMTGRALNLKHESRRAEPYLREALKIRLRAFSADNPAVVAVQSELGSALLKQRRYAEAEGVLAGAYEKLRSALGENHTATKEALHNLTEARFALRR